MFVLPPPPRYPSALGPYGVGVGLTPMIETNNVLTHPEGPEYTFLVGEGEYVLKEDLHLATPPPHPSETPVTNPNPLSTVPLPESIGTRLTLLNLDAPGALIPVSSFAAAKAQSATTLSSAIQEHPNESRYSTDPGALSSDEGGRGTGASMSDVAATGTTAVNTPAFGEGNALLLPPPVNPKDAGKKKKPKNSMAKSNSSFISRVINHDSFSKRLQERSSDGLFAFANINRAFQWLDLSDENKKADYLTKILFTKAHCLCHDINPLTKSSNHIDVIMGFSTGDIIWWEPYSQKYTRLNKNGAINTNPVVAIRWIPGSEQLFLAAHKDGSLVVYDKEREDTPFVPEDETPPASGTDSPVPPPPAPTKYNYKESIHIKKSVFSKNQKTNPVAYWKVAHMKINAFAFSPDSRHLALVFDDGSLRIMDYLKEKLVSIYFGYYGGLICVCWSPDGKYVVAGGQDDMLHIWHPSDHSLVAYCEGHKSWVSSVAFDPWRCDDKNLRFGSVGDDRRLCLWDFNVGMLNHPRAASILQRQQAAASLSTTTLARQVTVESNGGAANGSEVMGEDKVVVLKPQSRSMTAMLPPVLTKQVDNDPVQWLTFTEDAIITSCKTGHIRTWSRPTDSPATASVEPPSS